MVAFSPVEPLAWSPSERPALIVEALERWVRSDALRSLVVDFGGPEPTADLGRALDGLERFSADHWDFRKGAERNLAQQAEVPADLDAKVRAAASALGLRGAGKPRHESYDQVLILGGLVRACLTRPQRAAELVAAGLAVGQITGLGGFREIGGNEHELIAKAGLPDVGDEVEAMEAGIRRAFDLGAPTDRAGEDRPENPNLSWRVTRWQRGEGPELAVVAAPTTDPDRRANTPDTYAYWATDVARLDQASRPRVLLVTSSIYVPFQHADAIRMLALPYGAEVETIGVDTENFADKHMRQEFTAANYLQEFRSTIRAFRNLLFAVR